MDVAFFRALIWFVSRSPNCKHQKQDNGYTEEEIEKSMKIEDAREPPKVVRLINQILLGVIDYFFPDLQADHSVHYMENISVYWQKAKFISLGFVIKSPITDEEFVNMTEDTMPQLAAFGIKLKAQTNQRIVTLNFSGAIHLLLVLAIVDSEFRKPFVFADLVWLLSGVTPIKCRELGKLARAKIGVLSMMLWKNVKWIDTKHKQTTMRTLDVIKTIDWMHHEGVCDKEDLSYEERVNRAFDKNYDAGAHQEAELRCVIYKQYKLGTQFIKHEDGSIDYFSDQIIKNQDDLNDPTNFEEHNYKPQPKETKKQPKRKTIACVRPKVPNNNLTAFEKVEQPKVESTTPWFKLVESQPEVDNSVEYPDPEEPLMDRGEFFEQLEHNDVKVELDLNDEAPESCRPIQQMAVVIPTDEGLQPQLSSGVWKSTTPPGISTPTVSVSTPAPPTLSANSAEFVPRPTAQPYYGRRFITYDHAKEEGYIHMQVPIEDAYKQMTAEQILDLKRLEVAILEYKYKILALECGL